MTHPQLGTYQRCTTTGIAGRVIGVLLHELDATQFKLQRYGTDAYGKPFDAVWVFDAHCIPCDEEAARS